MTDHYHCPRGCEKPQAARYDGGADLICGRCWFIFGQRVPMIPCTSEICD